jgi:hypothetical protein
VINSLIHAFAFDHHNMMNRRFMTVALGLLLATIGLHFPRRQGEKDERRHKKEKMDIYEFLVV